jgi:hypothetical protein
MIGLLSVFVLAAGPVLAQQKVEKSKFAGHVTDSQGVETELKHMLFYWEEKVSETSFVPHEVLHVPAKKGNAVYNVRFEKIKQIDVKPGADKAPPAVTITLTSGKSEEFTLAVNGTFKGETDFGEVELPAHGLKKVVFK